MGAAVGEHLSTCHFKLVESAVLQAEVEMLVGVFLDWKAVVIKERVVLDQLFRIVKIDQDTNPAPLGWCKHGAKKSDEIKRREFTILRVK